MANHETGIQWTTSPTDKNAGEQLRIIRAPGAGALRFMILSHQVMGTYTHYLNGRTQPCVGKVCDGCAKAISLRWHGWVIVQNETTGEKYIFEFTEGPAEKLAEWYADHRTIRGLRCKVSRPSGKPNGRVILQRGDQVTNHAELPRCPEIQKVMLKIWGLDERLKYNIIRGGGPPVGTLDEQTYINDAV